MIAPVRNGWRELRNLYSADNTALEYLRRRFGLWSWASVAMFALLLFAFIETCTFTWAAIVELREFAGVVQATGGASAEPWFPMLLTPELIPPIYRLWIIHFIAMLVLGFSAITEFATAKRAVRRLLDVELLTLPVTGPQVFVAVCDSRFLRTMTVYAGIWMLSVSTTAFMDFLTVGESEKPGQPRGIFTGAAISTLLNAAICLRIHREATITALFRNIRYPKEPFVKTLLMLLVVPLLSLGSFVFVEKGDTDMAIRHLLRFALPMVNAFAIWAMLILLWLPARLDADLETLTPGRVNN